MAVAANSGDIAQAIERGISGQSDLLTTLAVAIIAGLLALLYQVRALNAGLNEDKRIELRCMFFFWLTVVAAGAAVGFGYGISGYLVQYAPALHAHSFETSKAFVKQPFTSDKLFSLQVFSQWQVGCFSLAALAGIWFVFVNRK